MTSSIPKPKVTQPSDTYLNFKGISSANICPKAKKAEKLFEKIDMMARNLPNSDVDGDNYIIGQALYLLQDMLHEDVPVNIEYAMFGLNELASQFRSDAIEANKMFDFEQGQIDGGVLSRVKTYVSERYKDMPNPHDLGTLCLVARFNKISDEMNTDVMVLVESQRNKDNYRSFGLRRLNQLEVFSKWMESSNCTYACNAYRVLRRYRMQENVTIPMSSRIELHG